MKYANLHLHSNHSDGGFRPAFLTRMAKALGYQAIALTDHETLTGLSELFEAGKHDGIEVMAGIELCTYYKGHEIHITGLDFDVEHPSIVNISKQICEGINERARIKFENMIDRGVYTGVSWEDVKQYAPATDFYCIDHICHAFDKLGICKYTEQDKVRKHFEECDPRKYHFQRPSVEETIQSIRNAGGIAVLAHPSEEFFDEQIVESLVELGVNGIEVSHPDITERGAKLASRAALEYGLYSSGGTDHTGVLSACNGVNARWASHGATEDEFKAIKERTFT